MNAGRAPEDCFQCGLPVAPGGGLGVTCAGRWRPVCCAGCEAVAGAILGQGLGDFYRLRDGAPRERAGPHQDDSLQYDHPDVQRSFVHEGADFREATLLLQGVRCSACVWLNERAISAVPGVLEAEANYATRRVRVRWVKATALSAILRAVARLGYGAVPHGTVDADALRKAERRAALWRLFVAAFGMMQVMMYALPAYIAAEGDMSFDAEQIMRWASFALTVPVVVYSAGPFFSGAWRALRHGRAGMDLPVALGVAVAFAASLAATLSGRGDVYYDSVTMFVFLLLAGRYLEMLARQRASRSLERLEHMIPECANRLLDFPASLATERVPAASLRRGDHVLARPGESFAADCTLVQGAGLVSEALLTGESRPLSKVAGDRVLGGSVNVADALVARVEKVGADTVLSAIRRLVERAAGERPPFVQLADRASSAFVLLVLALAAVAALAWAQTDPSRAVLVAVAVLVATCPCAFSLAAPAAHAVAAGELAAMGIVSSRGHTLEALARATDVVLDKTGTVTQGEPALVEVVPLGSVPRERLLAVAAAMEAASEHPVGKALVAAAGGALLAVRELRSFPGSGIEALVESRRYWLGAAHFGRAGRTSLPPALSESADTVVWLSSDDGLLGAFRLADRLRPEAAEALARLRGAGVAVHLLSGDSVPATHGVAAALQIGRWQGDAGPERKRAYVRDLQRQGKRVVMVGDGINDAPVLAQADVSLAMGGGAVLAQTQSDAVIVSNDLRALAEAVLYARRTLRVVRQNVAWAFAYNLTILPLAIAGTLTPWAAALGMSASSLVVVLNALRLQERS